MSDVFRIIAETENKLVCQPPNQPFTLDFVRGDDDRKAFELARRTIAVFNDWLSSDKADDRDTMSVIGSHLYSLLFAGKIDEAFRGLWNKRLSEGNSEPLRIVIEFQEAAAWLAELPWEFLYLPETSDGTAGFFLCSQEGVVLSRTVNLKAPQRKTPSVDDPIRILVILSEPKGENIVSDGLVTELEKLKAAYGSGIHLSMHIREGRDPGVPGPTRADLKAWIGDKDAPPDIVHFLGHGRYARNSHVRLEKGELALVDASDGAADWCADQDFADFFDALRLPKLVFLHACESGATASYRGFKGLALSLIKRGIPNVVAMQYPVENRVANTFAETFYKAVLSGEPIDTAVQRGRFELGTGLTKLATTSPGANGGHYSDRRFGSPIVFVQAWQGLAVFGRSLEGAGTAVVGSAVADDGPDEMPCPYACKSFHKRTAAFCDQGKGRLMTCARCHKFMRGDAVVCQSCGAAVQAQGASPFAGAAEAEGRGSDVSTSGLDRFRASAESSATHGSSGFSGRPGT